MKHFNNIKLLSSFREISNVLEIIAIAMRIFAFALIAFQSVMLFREIKDIKK